MRPLSPTISLAQRTSPSIAPSIWISPSETMSPVTVKSGPSNDGTAAPFLPSALPRGRPVALAFENMFPRAQEFLRIDRLAVHDDLVVQMRAGAPPGIAEQPDRMTEGDSLARLDQDLGEVAVTGPYAHAVVDLDQPAVTAAPTGADHPARGGGAYLAVDRGGQVEAGMVTPGGPLIGSRRLPNGLVMRNRATGETSGSRRKRS